MTFVFVGALSFFKTVWRSSTTALFFPNCQFDVKIFEDDVYDQESFLFYLLFLF